jgi:hypothetical protein
MKALINRVFSHRDGRPFPSPSQNSTVSSELTTSDIENYYLRIIIDCLRRLLVSVDSIDVRIRRAGIGPGGLTAFAGYVRIIKWDPALTPVLLQNMPIIDDRVRKVVNASVILEHTHFAGLWFQATSSTEGAPSTLLGLPSELIHQSGSLPPGGAPSGSSTSS